MLEKAYHLTDNADDLRNAGRLVPAAETYTAAAHEYAGTVQGHTFPEPDKTTGAVSTLRYAATCYRIAGKEFQTINRCELGVLLAQDYIEYIDSQDFEHQSFADVRRGAWPEFIGDLRTIADQEGAESAYDRAEQIYESAGSWEICMAEQEHMRLTSYFRNIRLGLGHDVSDKDIEMRPLGPTFTEWLQYKRKLLPEYLSQLENQGSWPTQK